MSRQSFTLNSRKSPPIKDGRASLTPIEPFDKLKAGSSNRSSFTLIELLVVLAIVAIVSVVVILTLNPAEILKQARDSSRLSDLSTLNTALAAYSADITGGGLYGHLNNSLCLHS